MHRLTASLLAVGLLAASALAEVPATKTPAAPPPTTPKATSSKTDSKTEKVAVAKKPATHRHHKRHARTAAPKVVPATK